MHAAVDVARDDGGVDGAGDEDDGEGGAEGEFGDEGAGGEEGGGGDGAADEDVGEYAGERVDEDFEEAERPDRFDVVVGSVHFVHEGELADGEGDWGSDVSLGLMCFGSRRCGWRTYMGRGGDGHANTILVTALNALEKLTSSLGQADQSEETAPPA